MVSLSSGEPRRISVSHQQHDLRSEVILQAILPAALFVTLLAVFLFSHRFPLLPWICTAAAANIVLLGAWPAVTGPLLPHHWLPLAAGVLACCCGAFFGCELAALSNPHHRAKLLRAHRNVCPEAETQGYADAGLLGFVPGAMVDACASAGYLDWPRTFCAAPVRQVRPLHEATTSPRAAVVGFWAVGLDCCASRGDFQCGEVRDPDARAGLRVDDDTAETYMPAVRMAAAANGLEVAQPPILLTWSLEPQRMAKRGMVLANVAFASLTLVALVGAAFNVAVLRRVATPLLPDVVA